MLYGDQYIQFWICILAFGVPLWCVFLYLGRKLRIDAIHAKEKLLCEFVYGGIAKAEELSFRDKKTNGPLDATVKEEIALQFVMNKTSLFTEDEIREQIPSILAKVANAGATNKVKL